MTRENSCMKDIDACAVACFGTLYLASVAIGVWGIIEGLKNLDDPAHIVSVSAGAGILFITVGIPFIAAAYAGGVAVKNWCSSYGLCSERTNSSPAQKSIEVVVTPPHVTSNTNVTVTDSVSFAFHI